MRRVGKISSDFQNEFHVILLTPKIFVCNIMDNPQLSVFIRSVNSLFEVTEELLGLEVLDKKYI